MVTSGQAGVHLLSSRAGFTVAPMTMACLSCILLAFLGF